MVSGVYHSRTNDQVGLIGGPRVTFVASYSFLQKENGRSVIPSYDKTSSLSPPGLLDQFD
nr:MAG TPA: hypothetical protein [Caudoviricetes sp.]